MILSLVVVGGNKIPLLRSNWTQAPKRIWLTSSYSRLFEKENTTWSKYCPLKANLVNILESSTSSMYSQEISWWKLRNKEFWVDSSAVHSTAVRYSNSEINFLLFVSLTVGAVGVVQAVSVMYLYILSGHVDVLKTNRMEFSLQIFS